MRGLCPPLWCRHFHRGHFSATRKLERKVAISVHETGRAGRSPRLPYGRPRSGFYPPRSLLRVLELGGKGAEPPARFRDRLPSHSTLHSFTPPPRLTVTGSLASLQDISGVWIGGWPQEEFKSFLALPLPLPVHTRSLNKTNGRLCPGGDKFPANHVAVTTRYRTRAFIVEITLRISRPLPSYLY